MGCEEEISIEHITNNQAVRNTLLERGIRPAALQPCPSTSGRGVGVRVRSLKVERRLVFDEKKFIRNPNGLAKGEGEGLKGKA